jgi:hypothetical protein
VDCSLKKIALGITFRRLRDQEWTRVPYNGFSIILVDYGEYLPFFSITNTLTAPQ